MLHLRIAGWNRSGERGKGTPKKEIGLGSWGGAMNTHTHYIWEGVVPFLAFYFLHKKCQEGLEKVSTKCGFRIPWCCF